ncbi:TonB-dependent receptor [Methylocaldum szegediense]|uniref:Iron complex outermembrane recepter protein n=1 Tax=Methylocaldum szegediense TaxID=73780 RepID=A0ABM9HY52_9GAMM|nr:TonB-dependent receptor [Methylocaldum szegediense]CAI8755514.1 iron complex outermembrane recepter protein [Methylocaldum szegediense]
MNDRVVLSITLAISFASVAAEEDPVKELDSVLVTAPVDRQAGETARPFNALTGDELSRKAANTLGETLNQELGVTSSSFGAGVGQPVIRGQSGPRVRVMQDSLGIQDVSTLSPDHANVIEPILAERIEVLRGPQTLLYGSGAIGGLVNVIDNRIPDRLPERLVTGAVEQRYSTVSDETTSVVRLDAGHGFFVLHLDGFYRDRNDVGIPGFAIDEKAEAAAHGAEGHEEAVVNTKGYIANTDARARGGTVGFSLVGDSGFLGSSVNRLENDYGIPPGAHDHVHEDGDETDSLDRIRVDMEQSRYDFKGELYDPVPFAETLRMRLGYTDYRHVERHNGAAGTVFKNEAVEGRIELVHTDVGPWHGMVGAQVQDGEFSALGEEAVVPKSNISSYGFFAVEDMHWRDVLIELGLRVEVQTISPEGRKSRSHTPVSASGSLVWDLREDTVVTFAVTRSQRAPQVQELFSNGFHAATRSFERGNPGLKEETSYNLDLGFRYNPGWVSAEINLFHNWVDDYIFQRSPGVVFNRENEQFEAVCSEQDVCIPVLESTQVDATFKGFEASLKFPVFDRSFGKLELTLFSDYVRGRLDHGGDVPRMPPLRYGFQVDYSLENLTAFARLMNVEAQNKPGENETRTDGYLLFNVGAEYRLAMADYAEFMVFVRGKNLFDEPIRNSTSYLRNIAPEPGRTGEFGIRVNF